MDPQLIVGTARHLPRVVVMVVTLMPHLVVPKAAAMAVTHTAVEMEIATIRLLVIAITEEEEVTVPHKGVQVIDPLVLDAWLRLKGCLLVQLLRD